MSDNKNVDNPPTRGKSEASDTNLAVSAGEVSSVTGSVKTTKTFPRVSSSSERQIKFERAQKCLENAALVSKRIKEHRRVTAELLGRPFEEDDGDTASEMASTMSERTGYSAATDTSTTMSVQDALNIPGISESLANTLKQKELLMERIKQYKEISKRPMKTSAVTRKDSVSDSKSDMKKDVSVSNVTQLLNTIKEKENALNALQVKMKAMETTIMEFQEIISEKDQIIDAKNMATTLMSDNLSKKDKDSLVLLEDTKQQMTKMQENFLAMELEWKEEKHRLVKQIEERDEKICNLEEANTILENARFEISKANSNLIEELDLKSKQILELQEKIETLSCVKANEEPDLTQKEKPDVEEEKGAIEIGNMVELTKKIELLEQLNCQIRQTNKELENKLASLNTEPKSPAGGSPSKKGSPLPIRKGGRNTASKMKSPWSHLSTESLTQETEKKSNKNDLAKLEMLLQSLNKDILDKEYVLSQKDELISQLQSTNDLNTAIINELKSNANKYADKVDKAICTELIEVVEPIEVIKHIEIADREGIEMSTDIKTLQDQVKAAHEQIAALDYEIDAANKNMIKVKSNQKLKLKQMQKTIDNFSKVSDANAEIVKLNEELHQLSQKVAELEEEKGNLQLHLVDYDSGRLTESDIYKKMVEMENVAEARLKAISVLEAQKFDLVQELHELQQTNAEMEDKLADISQLQSEQVSSEMKSVQLEEHIDQLTASKRELELVIENVRFDKDQMDKTIKLLEGEKDELIHKLQNYIHENMELTDKLEKLSAEKVSSAESIEIVESLTTQEKLELEEYNKGMSENKAEDSHAESYKIPETQECNESIEKLVEQSVDLNRKIELFTQERQEVMEKMSKLGSENQSLHKIISELNTESSNLQNTIDLLKNEKHDLGSLNEELNQQIEDLKRERLEIMKETVELAKPASVDEMIEVSGDGQHDDKTSTDKGNNRTKSVKQLTKEILKLKNTIKEREDEIGDCQMKILSLEEQQQKQNELTQMNASYESKIKSVIDENNQLKEEIDNIRRDEESKEDLLEFKQAHDSLQQEIHKLRQDYSNTVNARDARINELENVLQEYEKQIFNYGTNLQQKDKEIAEYINQITKLNDVSQKLKSTIDILEQEKAKDQSAELVKSLNKQITSHQKKLSECEEKLRILEEEKSQLLSLKGALDNKNQNLEIELKKMQDAFAEKQHLIKELQMQQQKHTEEISAIMQQVKERDEEVHEMKLQLRKESIENEKLRNTLSEKDTFATEFTEQVEEANEKFIKLSAEHEKLSEQYSAMETKNKELMEKLKKFAASMKKKSSMYNELESIFNETQKQLQTKNEHLEQLMIQVETLPALQEKMKHAEEELNRLQSQKVTFEQLKSNEVQSLQSEITSLEDKLGGAMYEISKLNESKNLLLEELNISREDNNKMKLQIETLNNKLADQEIEQKNNTNFITKISSLEADISQKQMHITELLHELESQEQQRKQLQFGHDAKLQEHDLYIEGLETEISKYKNRICRLEESISIMEDRRHSLERKADQLDSQLQEKQKAYSQYTSQEDQLVSRLAVLMDHDRVVEKQLHEIENENKELQNKIQHYSDENHRLRTSLSDMQEHCNTLVEKASKADLADSAIANYQTQIHELESNLKRVTNDHQLLLVQRKQDIDELDSEFNTQIENAIKEKKTLSEHYERVCEHVNQLELKLQEYRSINENLNINIQELTRMNEELIDRHKGHTQVPSPDYTEQYINEINTLNAVVNSKNQEIQKLSNEILNLKTSDMATISSLESKIAELTDQLQYTLTERNKLEDELKSSKQIYAQLQTTLSQKDAELQQLIERKKVSFEMNIPKTEGMIISSTIEALDEGPKFDMSSLESQIVDSTDSAHKSHSAIKVYEPSQKSAAKEIGPEGVVEELIMPKKSYLCYKGEEDVEKSDDPFNSDEGWGLGENVEADDITPGHTQLNDKIQQLTRENEILKSDLDASNVKCLKALKKLKELKVTNDMLSNELKTSRQLSQSSFLDSAIEDEMKINIQTLEKKVDDLTSDLSKEKRDKETVKKQNDIFMNAQDRLTEMKEKLENEVELWKFKFKEANDKLSTLQWGAEAKDSPDHKVIDPNVKDSELREEMIKLEKENDELQSIIDQLTCQNKELTSKQIQIKFEITELQKQLQQYLTKSENTELLDGQVLELQASKAELIENNRRLTEENEQQKNRYSEIMQKYDQLITESEYIKTALGDSNQELIKKNKNFEEELQSLRQLEAAAKIQISSLTAELETAKLLWHEEKQNTHKPQLADTFAIAEKYSAMEDYTTQLKHDLVAAQSKITQLETENSDILQSSKSFEEQINELNEKIKNLNAENDQLLSTVAELRSSVSSAVDQRGFEIAELWKQHLAQREADFQKTEQELRGQISAFEAKYEQLLDNVQSSSQEETNQLVVIEQMTSIQNKLQDKEDHLRNLQDKYAEVINELDNLRSEMEDEKIMHENKILAQQEEYEKQIKELTENHQQHSLDYERSYKTLQTELSEAKTGNDDLIRQIQDLVNEIEEYKASVLDMTTQLRTKDSEIYQKTHDYTLTLTQRNEEFDNVRQQLLEYEKKIEDLCYEKESELAVLRLKMHEKREHHDTMQKESEAEMLSLSEELKAKIIECTSLNKQISDLNKMLEEQSKTASEMQEALENQELEIVTLKDEISNLQDQLRISNSRIEKHVTFASDTKAGADGEKSDDVLNKELLDAVPRAELDLALYMLHQRDVRCEELTMELTQLLEERDTLQLRLSDSLRSYEELKLKCQSAGLDVSMSSSHETVSELPSFSMEREQQFVDIHRGHTSRSSSISDPDGEKPKLQAKLSELRSVRHSRDVLFRNESESRQLDLRLLQRDVANLPPEAVDQLAQAHHTLSRDSQSTSTVLLNWLRGKSTPKVVHM